MNKKREFLNEYSRRLTTLGLLGGGGGGAAQTLAGITYTKEAYADYVAGHAATGCTVDDLGACSDGVNHIYGLSVGDAEKPVIMLTGVIHGAHEWNNAYILRKFMEYFVSPPSGMAALFTRILSRFQIYCIPCVNPYGYINNDYSNANNVNLNRNFDLGWAAYDDSGQDWTKGASAFSEVETQIVRDKLLALDPVGFVDCHIEGGSGFKLNILYREYANESFMLTLKTAAETAMDNVNLGVSPSGPMAGTWARDQIASTNRYPVTCVFETGTEYNDTDKSEYMLNGLLKFCLTLDAYADQGYPEAFSFTYQPDETTGFDTQISAQAAQAVMNWGTGPAYAVGMAAWVRRSLIKMPTPDLPSGYNVASAVCTLYCMAEDAATDYAVGFHRALREWFEGNQNAAAPAAGEDGSTWNLRNANGSVAWGAPGGQSGVDYAAVATASVPITGIGFHAFDVTADYQAWWGGESNYGWFLINASEGTDLSRKSFHGSGAIVPSQRPKVVITFI